MKVIYVSCLYGNNVDILYKKNKPGQQVQIFNRLIVDGLLKNNVKVICRSVVPTSRDLIDKTFYTIKNEENILYYSIINIPIIKDIIIIIKSFIITCYEIIFKKDLYYVCDVLSTSNALGTVMACKFLNHDFTGIITDVPEYFSNSKLFNKLTHIIINNCSKYVFLTEKMNDVLNDKNKPYIVIEGMCSSFSETKGKKSNCIMYAGSIDKINGINNLVDAYNMLDTDYELHIYGEGDFEEELNRISKINNKIKFYGRVDHGTILEKIQDARFLINPRPNDMDLVKYSFPSKTLEYLASGTPFISTNLPCYPNEYLEYINILKGYTPNEILHGLNYYLSIDYGELKKKALKGKEFVLKEKNNKVQALKLINLMIGEVK